MVMDLRNGSGLGAFRFGPAVGVLVLLSGCMGGMEMPSLQRSHKDAAPSKAARAGSFAPQEAVNSSLIANLQGRRSVLPAGGPYAQVADAVVAASSGAAEAELRVARLKAEARSKNWLPSIGPSVNLTSMSGLAASLLAESSVFDHGGKKAQREFASADVEVAAVGLAAGMNQRVFEGLSYYVNAERARAQAAVSEKAATRLQGFETIMAERVAGGISDRSEQQVISQKYAEMRATLSGDQQAQDTAMVQLGAVAGRPLEGLHGLDDLPDVAANKSEPLSVVQARGEGARALAQAQAEMASLKPGISATANVTEGNVNPGLRLNPGGLFNPGAGAQMEALRQTADVVARQNAEAAETANRRIVALDQQKATLLSRQAQGAEVLRQTEGNLELFTEQYKVGRRTLLELVGQYDSYARLERDQTSLRFDIALIDLEIARDRGLLVEGARM